MNKNYTIPTLPLPYDLETKPILRQANLANKKLAELKGVALTIPNEDILLNTLILQEAKDSSEVENIVTTHDDLYRADLDLKQALINAPTKEVLNYRWAMTRGFTLIRNSKLLTNNIIKQIQLELEMNSAGIRTVPGTTLKNNRGEVVYTPPQDGNEIIRLMDNLERFINDKNMSDIDPLIKTAIIHHQFESIHPFYDGNGRTGRIVAVLYLVINDLIDLPILYLSRYITHNKAEYYRLLQEVRNNDGNNKKEWEDWILSAETIRLVKGISTLMMEYKQKLRPLFLKQYKHELLNNLFSHPYTKIEFIERDMMVQRQTASKYLDMIVDTGLLSKIKLGRSNYYMNKKLTDLFINHAKVPSQETDTVESVHNTVSHG